MLAVLADKAAQEYRKQFGEAPAFVVRAPGRVNMIGEHTDYNDGFVLPMAIDRASWLAVGPRGDVQVNLYSIEHRESATFHLDDLKHEDPIWAEYPRGTAWALQEAGYELRGFNAVTACDVPMGAGLSSSASFEMATARAFSELSGFEFDVAAMARMGQRAENKWVGVNCGIMDQMISAGGQEGHALLIDCRSLRYEAVPLPQRAMVVVMDTATRRGLVDSAYNERRAQCEAAASAFGAAALRDVSLQQLNNGSIGLDEMTLRRARHVVSENHRTEQAAAAMRGGDANRLGQLMDESHGSLRDDFEVSSPELDIMVKAAQAADGCYGARMTGAGFGGCAVALVGAAHLEGFLAHVTDAYRDRAHLEPALYACRAAAGAGLVLTR